MTRVRTPRLLPLLALVALSHGCGGGDSTSPSTPPPADNTTIINGCASLVVPIARPGDSIGGDNYQTFARPFFAAWCLRCHSSTLTTDAVRNGAPLEFNWDVESVVRANLPRIRTQVGVLNSMPLLDPRIGDPLPSCDERRRLIRWIDAGAP